MNRSFLLPRGRAQVLTATAAHMRCPHSPRGAPWRAKHVPLSGRSAKNPGVLTETMAVIAGGNDAKPCENKQLALPGDQAGSRGIPFGRVSDGRGDQAAGCGRSGRQPRSSERRTGGSAFATRRGTSGSDPEEGRGSTSPGRRKMSGRTPEKFGSAAVLDVARLLLRNGVKTAFSETGRTAPAKSGGSALPRGFQWVSVHAGPSTAGDSSR